MRKQVIGLLSGLFLGASGWAAESGSRFEAIRLLPPTEWEAKGGGSSPLCCPLVEKGPVLDGKLDEACWKEAHQSRDLIKSDGGIGIEIPGDKRTHVLLCRDQEKLYVAFVTHGGYAKQVATSRKGVHANDEGNYEDFYGVALKMLDAKADYRFFTDSMADVGVSWGVDDKPHYAGTFEVKSAPTEDGAIVEMAIPFGNPGLHAPKDGEWWQMRLNRVSNFEWMANNIQDSGFDFLYFGSEKDFRQQHLPVSPAVKVYGERYVYFKSDVKTQFVAAMTGDWPKGAKGLLALFRGDQQLDMQVIPEVNQPYLAFVYDQRDLTPGAYRMQVTLQDKAGKNVLEDAWPFTVSAQKEAAIPFPQEGVSILVHPQKEVIGGAWPVSTGVPLPRGAIADPSRLELLEDGKPIPANLVTRTTWDVTLKWKGAVPEVGEGNSIKWLGLSFVARYNGDKPRAYVLRQVQASQEKAVPSSRLTVTEDDKQITINTGPARLTISKTSFDGVQAWLGQTQVLLPGGGPYIVDQNGKRYNASGPLKPGDKIEAFVEEQGPARVVVTLKGWYHSADKEPLCIYNTRIIAYNGLPYFEVKQRTILTCDNRQMKLADVGFVLKTPETKEAFFGADGKVLPAGAAASGAWSSSIHQDRSDHFRLLREDQGAAEATVIGEGKRADGYAGVAGDGFNVSVFLQDVWEKYPKELEAGSGGLNVHFWPRHGYKAFKDEEIADPKQIHKSLFAHTGKLMDLNIPEIARKTIIRVGQGNAASECRYGCEPPALGVTIANDFFVLLEARKAEAPLLTAGLVRQDPTAYADPAYACATDAFDKIHQQDFKNFPLTERRLEKAYLALYHFDVNSEAYGMFIYANWNTEHTPGVNYLTNFNRLFGNSHYQEVSAAWLLYYRSGDPEMLKWARAHGGNFMNIATCNYDEPGHPMIANNPDGGTWGFHVPMAGQMFHCKSSIPWGGPLATDGHFIDPQSYYMRYCLEGDYEGMDNYAQWGRAIKRSPISMTPHRDTNNTISHLALYYSWSYDPYALVLIHRCAVPLIDTPFAKHGAGSFHKYWAARYYDLTRDPRAVERIKEWAAMVGVGAVGWQVDVPAAALLYRLTGDKKYLPVVNKGPAAYENPEDSWDGYSLEAFMPYAGFYFSSVPAALHSLSQAGLTEETAQPRRSLTPQMGPVFKDRAGQDADVEVLLVKKEDRAFNLVIENAGVNEDITKVRILGPDGQSMMTPFSNTRDQRFLGEGIARLSVPKNGKTGLLQLAMRGGNHQLSFFMPATNLEGEAAVLRPNGTYELCGPVYYVSPRSSQGKPLTFDFAPNGFDVGVIRIVDDKGVEAASTSVAKGLKRAKASLTVDPAEHPLPWLIEVAGCAQVNVRMDPADVLYLAPDKARLNAVLEAVRK